MLLFVFLFLVALCQRLCIWLSGYSRLCRLVSVGSGCKGTGERCASASAPGRPIGVHILPRELKSEDCRSQCQQAAAAKSEGVCSSREGCQLLISFRSACHGQGAPLVLSLSLECSMVAVTRWGHAWITGSWGGVSVLTKWLEACVLVHGMWAHGEEPGDWGVACLLERGALTFSSRRLAAAVLLVAEAASFLCRGGCWGSLQQTLQNPSVQAAQVFHTAEGLLSPQWPGLSVFSAEQVAGDQQWYPCGLRRRPPPFVVLHHFQMSQLKSISSVILPVQSSSTRGYTVLLQVLVDSCVLFLGQVSTLLLTGVIIGPRLGKHPPLFAGISLPVHFSGLLS